MKIMLNILFLFVSTYSFAQDGSLLDLISGEYQMSGRPEAKIEISEDGYLKSHPFLTGFGGTERKPEFKRPFRIVKDIASDNLVYLFEGTLDFRCEYDNGGFYTKTFDYYITIYPQETQTSDLLEVTFWRRADGRCHGSSKLISSKFVFTLN